MDADIAEHLPTLTNYASVCESVTEFGFRTGTSLKALIDGKPRRATTYDLHFHASDIMKFNGVEAQVKFCKENTAGTVIEETDLLFIDSLHTYQHLSIELKNNHHMVKKYLIFHDVQTYGSKSEDGTEPGLTAAIFEFLRQRPEWGVDYYTHECNGLLVLKRCAP